MLFGMDVFDLGKYGVQLFFVISGFLAFQSLERSNWKLFYIKRIIRLFSLYYFSVACFFVLETYIYQDCPVDPMGLGWCRYIFVFNGIVPHEGYFWGNIGITWTIPVFFCFYLVCPLLFHFLKSIRSSLISLIASFPVAYLVHKFAGGWFSFMDHIPCFLVGITIYWAFKDGKAKQITALFSILVVPFTVYSYTYGFSFLFGILLYLVSELQIRWNIVFILDEYSYAVYLGHGIVLCGIIDHIALVWPIRLLIILTGSVAISVATHLLIEKPAQQATKRISEKLQI